MICSASTKRQHRDSLQLCSGGLTPASDREFWEASWGAFCSYGQNFVMFSSNCLRFAYSDLLCLIVLYYIIQIQWKDQSQHLHFYDTAQLVHNQKAFLKRTCILWLCFNNACDDQCWVQFEGSADGCEWIGAMYKKLCKVPALLCGVLQVIHRE